uniref:NADH:ubiquinone reductase (H(+)-translocating) n=1 Tax=Echinostoma miyagawai TaxID=1579201 RepID=A0A5B9R2N4_9TREM|nr:NADH dehydrogenase subunit 5 [Echinostoma miyagawai]WCK11547.1 NADH dehydrogenase subunit 5 [Echinostoma miyagawai]
MLLGGLLLFGLLVWWFYDIVGFSGVVTWLGYGVFPSFSFIMDEVSLVCLYMLLCCGFVALFYCYHYFGGDSNGSLLFPLIVWFLGVMCFLVLTSSMLFSLVFWEYLGLVSFFLILFYSNMSSLRASLITLFASRFGDVSMFVVIMWLAWCWDLSSLLFVLLFLLVVMTKSACYPFVSWLLEAMRAPTPVSSLVHSSTLVAAGVWFVLRYNHVGGVDTMYWLGGFCLVTIMLTSFAALVFMDLKKIVALSTCNNVSWCVLFFIFGDVSLSLLQLVSHGVCKCYLFMSVGDLMGQSGSSQSSVGVFVGRYSGNFLPILHGFLVLSLCGLPFIGVFFSKHLLFSGLLYSLGTGFVLLFLFCLILSYVYSFRFVLLLLGSLGGLSSGYSSFFFIICPLVILGTFLNYLGGMFILEDVSMGSFFSSLILVLQVLGCLLGYFFYFYFMGVGRWSSVLSGCEGYVSMFYYNFVCLSSICVVSFYRWEVFLLNLLSSFSFRGWLLHKSFFSLNFLIMGLFFVFVFSFII